MEDILTGKVTERRNEKSLNLHNKSAFEIIKLMNDEDKKVAYAIELVLNDIAKAIDIVVENFKNGGRLIYMGAGTSGRLGILDSVECPPTFGVDKDMVVGIIAGGERAFIEAQEGVEDSETLGIEALKEIKLSKNDTLCAIAASGRTPFCIGGLRYAKEMGVKTIAIACNKRSKIGELADVAIEVEVGEEILTGSTRLKAGTAQKQILNMITTTSMTKLGKVYENLMIDLKITNNKLLERAKKIVMDITKVSYEEAQKTLEITKNNVKLAVVMLLKNLTLEEAKEDLKSNNGFVKID